MPWFPSLRATLKVGLMYGGVLALASVHLGVPRGQRLGEARAPPPWPRLPPTANSPPLAPSPASGPCAKASRGHWHCPWLAIPAYPAAGGRGSPCPCGANHSQALPGGGRVYLQRSSPHPPQRVSAACLAPARPCSAPGGSEPPRQPFGYSICPWGWPSPWSLSGPWCPLTRQGQGPQPQVLPGKGAVSPLLAPLGGPPPSAGPLHPCPPRARGCPGSGPPRTGAWTRPSCP